MKLIRFYTRFFRVSRTTLSPTPQIFIVVSMSPHVSLTYKTLSIVLQLVDKQSILHAPNGVGTLNIVIMEEVDNALKVSVGLKNQQKTEREENYG